MGSDTAIACSLLALSFLSLLILIPSLIVQLKSRNIALSALISSSVVLALLQVLNVLTWPKFDLYWRYRGQGLCDVEVKLIIGLNIAIPCALICLFRQVSIALQPDKYGLQRSEEQQRRRMVFEGCVCIGLPILRMTLVYIVQPDRYRLMGIHGCIPSVDTSWPSYLLVISWPVVIGSIGFSWAIATTWKMVRYHRLIAEMFAVSVTMQRRKSTLVRQYVLASIFFLIYTPFQVYQTYHNISPIQPYSWSRVHPPDWSERIALLPPSTRYIVYDFWNMAANFVIFGFFGFNAEARCVYRAWFETVAVRVGRSAMERSSSEIAHGLEAL